MANYRKILLKDYTEIREEFVAASAITPGMLVSLSNANKAAAHGVAAGNVTPIMVAVEDNMQGNGIDDAYAANDVCQVAILRAGDQFYGIIADGQNIAIGDLLESNGAGKLTKVALDSTGIYYTKSIVARAMEAVDMSGSAGVDPTGRIVAMVV